MHLFVDSFLVGRSFPTLVHLVEVNFEGPLRRWALYSIITLSLKSNRGFLTDDRSNKTVHVAVGLGLILQITKQL